MHSLLLKIFLAYWLAASVVIIVSDLQPHRLIHTPELSDALDTSLSVIGQSVVEAHESGNCAHVTQWLHRGSDSIGLVSSSGQTLCGDLPLTGLEKLIAESGSAGKRMTRDFARYQVIAAPVLARDGTHYTLLIKSGYTSTLEIFGFLPGIRTLQISIVVTFFLAVLIVLPLRRLRAATQRIADGKLDTRLRSGFFSRTLAHLGLRDDIDGLMGDFNGMAGRLQSLVNAQKLLLRDVSHELRSPLARLAVALELARDHVKDSPSDKARTHLDRIERESVRLNTLIGHILSFSYTETIRELHHSVDLSDRKSVV